MLAEGRDIDRNTRLDQETICRLPELKVNPFKDRICKVFSSSDDGSMTFEDFLDMMSVFSDSAPKNVKVNYAFKIYDFSNNNMITSQDLKEVVQRITMPDESSDKLVDEDLQLLIDNIMEEADLDNDDCLSFQEFEHVLSKSPDFASSFCIHL
ncbi:calcium and integrin-binding protein 1 [Octopus bimaculoides]|uniref:EF-hand domain-containing protein n=1 Tax=Octopus bimaculoides TaxID=37653 RepID=A0A0L8HBW0_OCTBM|nr:calcium and integrin-binding protein 1 [Octopus bimaculoides]|eukprot:XP_014773702.1 PREDICTED: calcium and integrin-binding protein 1-like [Octopus bimaculoides]